MSISVMCACWPLQMPPTPKAVLISLADNANDQCECWPSIEKICERTCFGRTAVIAAVKWLEENNLLIANRDNGRKTRYLLTIGKFNQSATRTGAEGEPVREADGTSPGAERDQSATRTGPVRQADTNHQEPSITVIKSNRQRKAPVDTAGTRFDEFWSAYPVKTEKRQCAVKWIAEGLDAHIDSMLADIAAKSEKDRRWLGGYIPNAMTYLNQERWNDPVQPVSQRPSVTDRFTQSSYEGSTEEELPESLRSPA